MSPRSDAVFFGEAIPVDALSRANSESKSCDLMLVIGTSGGVYPAASMPEIAKRSGAAIVEIDLTETPLSDFISDYNILGRSGDILEKLAEKVKELKEKG